MLSFLSGSCLSYSALLSYTPIEWNNTKVHFTATKNCHPCLIHKQVDKIIQLCSLRYFTFKIWKRSVPGQAAPGLRPHRTHSVAKKNLLKLLIIIVCVFAASWLPYHVIYFLQFSSDMYINCNVPETIMFYCLFVGHANSAINPCVYFVIHKEYRSGFAHS